MQKKKTKKKTKRKKRDDDDDDDEMCVHIKERVAQSARHPRVAALILPGKMRRECGENIESVFCNFANAKLGLLGKLVAVTFRRVFVQARLDG